MRIAFLTLDRSRLSDEQRAAFHFLMRTRGIQAKRVSLSQLEHTVASTSSFDLIWWHDDTLPLHASRLLDADMARYLRTYIEKGGTLLLSLLAARGIVDLDLEHRPPNRITRGKWREQPWSRDQADIRGFAGFQGHPIFWGLNGGVYTWNPTPGSTFAGAFYDDDLPDSGKIVAVERQYIRLNESRRLITEYKLKKGKVLTIGSYLFFQTPQHRFRPHLEQFTLNCLQYLTDRLPHQRKTYWDFSDCERRPVSPHFPHQQVKNEPISVPSPKIAIQCTSKRSDKFSFFHISGEQIKVVGSLHAGVEEVWSGSFRLLGQLKVGVDGSNSHVAWLHTHRAEIEVRPECLRRRYRIDANTTLEEIILCDPDLPVAACHLHLSARRGARVVIEFMSDLRMMWPLSERATGRLHAFHLADSKAVYCTNDRSDLHAFIGYTVEPSDVSLHKSRDGRRVNARLHFSFTAGKHFLSLLFSGSAGNHSQQFQAYRILRESPTAMLARQRRCIQKRGRERVAIRTPDEALNSALNWAAIGLEHLMHRSPDLGKSLVAGLGLSTSGWDGGHRNSGRPGYAWYFGRDSFWAALAFLSMGQYSVVRDILEFFSRHQDVDGKIAHEVTTSGFAHFDAADATPLYLMVFGRYLRASGDITFVTHHLTNIEKALAFCFSTDTDGDHLIENTNVGHGWVEGGRLLPVHTEYYLAACWKAALDEVAFIARSLRKTSLARTCAREASLVTAVLKNQFWNRRTRFINFGKTRNGRYVSRKTILPAVGIYFDCAGADQSRICARAFSSHAFSADWGARILPRDDPFFNPVGYHDGSVWPLFTGWSALAQFAADRPLQCYQQVASIAALVHHFSHGSLEEVFHGERFEPTGVCHHQAWSASMLLQPFIEGILGLRVDAIRRSVYIKPYLLPTWDEVFVENIRVAKANVICHIQKQQGKWSFSFKSKSNEVFHVTVQPRLPLGSTLKAIEVAGRRVKRNLVVSQYRDVPTVTMSFQNNLEIVFDVIEGVAFIPPESQLVAGARSKSIRLIEEYWSGRSYLLQLEGLSGTEYIFQIWDPNGRIVGITNGTILGRSGSILSVRVLFQSSLNRLTIQKKVTFHTNKL
jgi:glycogen debranching enzyme